MYLNIDSLNISAAISRLNVDKLLIQIEVIYFHIGLNYMLTI